MKTFALVVATICCAGLFGESAQAQTITVVPKKDPAQAAAPAGLVSMMDGSVRMIRPSVQESTFWAMVTRDGGEVAAE